jgi:glycosyltransferase involved in cell wall biosynthesis
MPHWAGTEKYIIDLSRELRRLGHETIIGCQLNSELNVRAREHGIPTIPLEMRKIHDWWQLPKFVRAMHKQFEIAHIHHHLDYVVPATAARIAQVPAVVMTRHLPHRFHTRIKAYACGEFFYDVIIAVSDAVRKTLLDCGIKPGRIRVVRNGVDPSLASGLNGARVRASLHLPPEAFLVGAAGRLEPEKGFPILLQAVAVARKQGLPVFAVIAGQGTQEAELRRLRDELGLGDAVQFLGFRKDVLDVIAATDVVVVPSIWDDPFPYAVLEAMACSKPVVASRVGGIPEMVTNDSALLVPLGDPDALACAITVLAKNPSRRGDMSRAAFAEVQRFTIPALAENVQAVYWEVLNRISSKSGSKTERPLGNSELTNEARNVRRGHII